MTLLHLFAMMTRSRGVFHQARTTKKRGGSLKAEETNKQSSGQRALLRHAGVANGIFVIDNEDIYSSCHE